MKLEVNMMQKNEIENAGPMKVLAASDGWVWIAACMGMIVTIASGGVSMAKNYIALGTEATANGVHLTYASLSAGVADVKNTAWKGWSSVERRGYALFEVEMEIRLQAASRRFLTDRNGGHDGREAARGILQDLVGGKAALRKLCKDVYEAVENWELDKRTYVLQVVPGDWTEVASIAKKAVQLKKNKVASISKVTLEHAEFSSVEELTKAAIGTMGDTVIGGWSAGDYVSADDISEIRSKSADALDSALG